MEFFRTNTKINFMKQRKAAAIFSGILIILSLFFIITRGLNLGMEFTGGNSYEVSFTAPAKTEVIRENLDKAGFGQGQVTLYGTTHDVQIRIGPHKEFTSAQLQHKVMKLLPPGGTITGAEFIGPQVGKQLVTNGILAILVSMIATMIYIALRFEYRFALSAAVALLHDPILILGIFAAFHLEFNLIVLAAILTIIGYSLNDTIVVYDRVRENFIKMRKGTPLEIMDLSINQTLSRTIMTSGLTMLVVVALFLYGGAMIHNFALAFIIGIIVGTYSSIYIAGALAIALGLNKYHLVKNIKRTGDALP